MKVNFDIKDNHALTYKAQHIDLHNNFTCTSCDYQLPSQELIVTWIKSEGDWIEKAEFSKLIFIHTMVSFININYKRNYNQNIKDDICLEGISFFPSSDRQVNNELMIQNVPENEDDIIYLFDDDNFIRVGCTSIELITE